MRGRPPLTAAQRFARNLAAARKALGMRQYDVIMRMRTRGHQWPQGTVSKIERGHRDVSEAEAESLAEIVGVSVHLLRTEARHRVAHFARTPSGRVRIGTIAARRRMEAMR
ncbi:helix-turn-helix domain-containing protein [Nocardia wallacei]|uniref:helix-turn-helix domain-containing protein n=1 Tax=Nocardia wallacei TaxID=480035 RepID=UPI0024573259|nr:helix-turn-helix domain-containing protein [Nocardia wallacei]